MNPSDIRGELLDQHVGLRGHLDSARLAAERWSLGDLSRQDLHARLAELATALRVHHAREERALTELIRASDDDGFSDGEHAAEHRELLALLDQVARAHDPGEAGRELETFCSQVLAHMTWEERAFLNKHADE
ncbi:MAG TPA: hemerythrin domain-containing protein [Polyangiaceae bacterium]